MTILSTKLKYIDIELSGKSKNLRIDEITTKIELLKVGRRCPLTVFYSRPVMELQGVIRSSQFPPPSLMEVTGSFTYRLKTAMVTVMVTSVLKYMLEILKVLKSP